MVEEFPRDQNSLTKGGSILYRGNLLLLGYSMYILLLAASCSNFAKTLVSQFIFLAFSLILLIKKNKKWPIDNFGLKFFGASGLLILSQFFITNVFMFGSVKYMLMIISVYYIVKEYKGVFIETLMHAVYILSCISIPLFIVQLINVNFLKSILNPFNFSFAEQSSKGGVYVFLFNINPMGLSRNSGFMWEPGAFGGILIFAIIYYYITGKKSLNRRIYVLSAIAITTVSTTTIMGLLLFVMLIILKNSGKKPLFQFFSFIVFILIAIQIYALPFMGQKINSYLKDNLDYTEFNENLVNGYTTGTSIGRFSGLLIELKRFPQSPIVGNGWDSNYSDLGLSNEWSNPNALANILGRFGTVGIAFLLYGLYCFISYSRSTIFIENGILMLILLMPMFSNPFELNLIFWSVVMTGVVMSKMKSNKVIQLQYLKPDL
jgi:hypothetical protein